MLVSKTFTWPNQISIFLSSVNISLISDFKLIKSKIEGFLSQKLLKHLINFDIYSREINEKKTKTAVLNVHCVYN